MRSSRRLVETALAALVVLACATHARADARHDAKIAKADQLFAEGKALMAANLLQACDKFDQSLRENPAAIGTLLNVALCDEKLGRVASAVAKFAEARDRAKEQGLTQHQRAAEAHLAELEPVVPHLAIQLTQTLPDTKILLDDRVIALDELADIAVDPGERVVVVSAPARLPYRTKLVVTPSQRTTVVIPKLARSVTVTSSRRRIGQIVTVAGVVGIGVGVSIGVSAGRLFDKQFTDGLCTHKLDGDHCGPEGQRNTVRAQSRGNAGTVVGLAGGVVAVSGALLWIFSRSSSRDTGDHAVTVVPQLGHDSLGVAALGRF